MPFLTLRAMQDISQLRVSGQIGCGFWSSNCHCWSRRCYNDVWHAGGTAWSSGDI